MGITRKSKRRTVSHADTSLISAEDSSSIRHRFFRPRSSAQKSREPASAAARTKVYDCTARQPSASNGAPGSLSPPLSLPQKIISLLDPSPCPLLSALSLYRDSFLRRVSSIPDQLFPTHFFPRTTRTDLPSRVFLSPETSPRYWCPYIAHNRKVSFDSSLKLDFIAFSGNEVRAAVPSATAVLVYDFFALQRFAAGFVYRRP